MELRGLLCDRYGYFVALEGGAVRGHLDGRAYVSCSAGWSGLARWTVR